MRHYKNLSKQEFFFQSFSITPIRDCDKWIIMNTRNEQMFHLRQKEPLKKVDQELYFNNVVSNLFEQNQPNQLLFSFLENNEFIGYGGLVHIDWGKKTAEISFIMLTQLEKDFFSKYWTIFLKLLEIVAFEELHFDSIFTYAYDLRPYLYPALEKSGFSLSNRLVNEIEINGIPKDVLIHTKTNPKLYFRIANSCDKDLIYEWANEPIVRENSFQSEIINYKNHCEWFDKTLKNEDVLMLLFYNELQKNIGLVRFQKLNNNEAVISISIDVSERGKGNAQIILLKSVNFYKEFSDKISIIAYIKPTNNSSIKLFKKGGFTEVKSDHEKGLKFIL